MAGSILGAGLCRAFPTKAIVGLDGIFPRDPPVLTLSESWTGYRIPRNDRIVIRIRFPGGLSGTKSDSSHVSFKTSA